MAQIWTVYWIDNYLTGHDKTLILKMIMFCIVEIFPTSFNDYPKTEENTFRCFDRHHYIRS